MREPLRLTGLDHWLTAEPDPHPDEYYDEVEDCCPTCGGSGNLEDGSVCPDCDGTGEA